MNSEITLNQGDVVAGKYRIIKTLGHGGMGVVVAADHLQLGRQVAIKLLKADADTLDVQRFVREAQTLAKISSEQACQVFDVGTLENGEPFMVMELLDGSDLSTLAKTGRPFGIEEVVGYVLQACEALSEAHSQGIVHRDLKPGNLFRHRQADGSYTIKLLDFGIAKQQGAEAHDLTRTDALVGSPRFMSPEQLRCSKHADMRSDIWSLGVLMYEMLSGEAAFGGETITEIIVTILQDEPRRLRELRPEVPPGLAQAIERCLEKNAENRPQTLADFALSIAPFGHAEVKASVDKITRLCQASQWQRACAPASSETPTFLGSSAMTRRRPVVRKWPFDERLETRQPLEDRTGMCDVHKPLMDVELGDGRAGRSARRLDTPAVESKCGDTALDQRMADVFVLKRITAA